MPHYRFTAVFNGSHRDETGEFLIDDAKAKAHAVQVIHELKHNNPSQFLGWSLRVTEEQREVALIKFDHQI